MAKLIAQIEVSGQVSHDEWRVNRKTMQLNDDTTMKEILEWVKKATGNSRYGIDSTAGGKVEIFNVE